MSDHDLYRAEFDVNRPLPIGNGKTLSARVNGIHSRGYDWFGTRIEEDAIAPSLRWDITPQTKLIAEYFYNQSNRPGGWATPVHKGDPRGITTGDGVYRIIPRDTRWNSPEDFRDVTRHLVSLDGRHAFSDRLQFRSQLQYESKVQLFEETFGSPESLTILRDTALTSRSWRRLPRDTTNSAHGMNSSGSSIPDRSRTDCSSGMVGSSSTMRIALMLRREITAA